MASSQKGGGRKKRKPAQMRYTSEKRWEKNKKRKLAKLQRHLARAKADRARRVERAAHTLQAAAA